MSDAIVPANDPMAVATRSNLLSEKDGLDLLSQIVNGELTATRARFASVTHEPERRAERSERLIVSVRHEQVEAIERTFHFVGSKSQPDEPVFIAETPPSPKLPAAADETRSGVDECIDQPAARQARMIELAAFIALGVVIAVLLSPYSPFAQTASILVVLIIPIGVLGVVVQAIAFQRRRSIG